MSRVCEPVRVDAMGACGCRCRLRVCNPGPTHTRDKGLTGSPGFASQCDRVTRSCFQRKCHGPPQSASATGRTRTAWSTRGLLNMTRGQTYKVRPRIFLFVYWLYEINRTTTRGKEGILLVICHVITDTSTHTNRPCLVPTSYQPTHNVHPGQHHPCPICQVDWMSRNPPFPRPTTCLQHQVQPTPPICTTTSPPQPARNPRMMRQTGRQGQIDTTKGRAYKVRRWSFILFLFTTDYCNSTMTRGNLPPPWPQCQPPPMNPASQTNANTVGVIESHMVVHHYTTWCHWNTGVHALCPSYLSPDFLILARLHGSVNWHLHCPCKVHWLFLEANPRTGWVTPGFS